MPTASSASPSARRRGSRRARRSAFLAGARRPSAQRESARWRCAAPGRSSPLRAAASIDARKPIAPDPHRLAARPGHLLVRGDRRDLRDETLRPPERDRDRHAASRARRNLELVAKRARFADSASKPAASLTDTTAVLPFTRTTSRRGALRGSGAPPAPFRFCHGGFTWNGRNASRSATRRGASPSFATVYRRREPDRRRGSGRRRFR